ncbi:MAG: tetratricopeptide repeat protein [Verrucomicrobia bacterium]|jgi:enediyne biosynthesis protein E4|nr:tetratricopeptide repeat protein [Verrucomicrobiota bacterium]
MSNPTPRQRKLRTTATALAWIGGLGLIIALVIHYRNRPSQYDPEEESEIITSNLQLNLPPGAPEPKFKDITQSAGLSNFKTFNGNRTSQLPEDMGGGAAFGDFDNDGDDDLFLVSAGGSLDLKTSQLAPCQLYRNDGKANFEQVTNFPELRIQGMGAAWGDFDDDGFIDLIITGYRSLNLFRNEQGSGRFQPITLPGNLAESWAGATWGDFDNDRDLDLYVTGYLDYHMTEADRGRISDQFQTAVPFTLNPASFNPVKNRLYRNNGDGSFTDVAESLEVTNPSGRSMGAVWNDFDQDGWLDLYVANDVSDNAFYHNNNGNFKDIAHSAWVADYRSAMGLTIGDWNNDGDEDLFVTHWVAQENALYDNTYADFYKAPSNQPNRTNVSENNKTNTSTEKPKARFVDIADMRGVGQMALPYVGWGTEFADLDHDGWMDLLVANGSTLEVANSIPRRLQPQEMFLLWNHAGETFHNIATAHPELNTKHISRGLALSDVDSDGDQDFIVVDLDGGVRLFRNDMAVGNWIQFRLKSRDANDALTRRGEHSTVIVSTGTRTFRRTFNSVSYLSQSTATLHVGLGSESIIQQIEVHWHAGAPQTFTNITPNVTWELKEGETTARRIAKSVSTHNTVSTTSPKNERDQTIAFWNFQRAGMNAFKQDRNFALATEHFKKALSLNANHEEALFYHASSLIELSRTDEAIQQLQHLTEVNPHSLRGYQQWGTLRSMTATTDGDWTQAEELLLKARAINPEETGVLQLLAEVALKREHLEQADKRFSQVIASNPRAARAHYLRAYISWKNKNSDKTVEHLQKAREALGPEWQPEGTTSEGDVQQSMHIHNTPYSAVFNQWDGTTDPDKAFELLAKPKQ